MTQLESRVIVGVDGSEDSLRAVRYALGEALLHDGSVHVIHGIDDAAMVGTWGVLYDPSLLEEAGREAVKEALALLAAEGLPADRMRGDVLPGNPAQVLVRASEEGDRIIMGRRAGGGLERMFVGSTSVAVATTAHCPVVVISAAANPDSTDVHGVVGVCVGSDGPIRGTGAMGWAFEEAVARKASVRILHVIQPPTTLFGGRKVLEPERREQLLANAQEQIEAGIAAYRTAHPEVEVVVDITVGQAIDTLIERSSGLDMLIMGAHSGFGQSLGGVVRGVMSHAMCPVGLIRAPREA